VQVKGLLLAGKCLLYKFLAKVTQESGALV
jgi:hypothetical protein